MADTITIRVAIQGDGVHPYNVPLGTTVAQLREIAQINEHLEFRINGETVSNDFVVADGTTVIGTQPVKGGIR